MSARLTVRRLMAIVVIAGLCLAAFRVHFSLGCFASAVLVVATLKTFGAIDCSRACGRPVSPGMAIRLFISSINIALALELLAFVPVILSLLIFIPIASFIPFGAVPAIVVAVTLATSIVGRFRRWFWADGFLPRGFVLPERNDQAGDGCASSSPPTSSKEA